MRDDSSKKGEEVALLVKKAKGGDTQAFDVIYTRYVTPIFRFIYLRVRNHHDAEDITQAVFVKAWGALSRFEDRGHSFSALLYTIAKNTVIDHWKKRREASLEDNEDTASEIKDEGKDVTSSLEEKERRETILRAIEKLSEDQQEIIMLKFIQDLSNKEIAAVTEKTEEAIRALQYRALKTLRGYFRDQLL